MYGPLPLFEGSKHSMNHDLSLQTMETLHQGEELIFLYQLIQGSCDTSYAGHVASVAGLPEHIVRRGNQVTNISYHYNYSNCHIHELIYPVFYVHCIEFSFWGRS